MNKGPSGLRNPRVVAVTPNDDYTLTLTFTNGEVKVYDMKPWLDKGVFRELRHIGYFRCVRVAFGTVEWPNEQDICPDTLYEKASPSPGLRDDRLTSRRRD